MTDRPSAATPDCTRCGHPELSHDTPHPTQAHCLRDGCSCGNYCLPDMRAATPEEVLADFERSLDDWRQRHVAEDPEDDDLILNTEQALDLIRRAQAAQREADAQIVEGLHWHREGSGARCCPDDDGRHNALTVVAAAIRAGE